MNALGIFSVVGFSGLAVIVADMAVSEVRRQRRLRTYFTPDEVPRDEAPRRERASAPAPLEGATPPAGSARREQGGATSARPPSA